MTFLVISLWSVMAAGVWLLAQNVPGPSRPRLADRVVPYLGRPQLRALAVGAPQSRHGWRGAVVNHGLRLAARFTTLAGGDSGTRRRLTTLGGPLTIDQYRLEQLLWGLACAASTALLLLLRGLDMGDLGPSLLVVVIAGIVGMLFRDRSLTRQVRRRNEQLRAELPTMVEMLAMAVAAGSGLLSALDRMSHLGSGILAGELARVISDVRVGLPLVPAMQRMADRNELPELRRFVDAVTISTERGTPLADVLVAQAADAREAERRALIESGGRKEIAMMVPVVFLVLPLSVVFVLFPGFYGLQLGS